MEAPGIEPFAARVENGRKRTQRDGNGRGSGGLNGKMHPFATAIRPDATASVYQVYQGGKRRRPLWGRAIEGYRDGQWTHQASSS